ncbi:hypothetical protein D3C81_1929130 [compost metagenome]
MFVIADDDHGNQVVLRAQLSLLQDLMRTDEADLATVKSKVLLPFQHRQLVAAQFQRAVYICQREGVRLIIDGDQQAADDG